MEFWNTKAAITPITCLDIYNLKPDREYVFRITPRNKYGWGESVVSSSPIRTSQRTGLPQFYAPLHPQLKALLNSNVTFVCEVCLFLLLLLFVAPLYHQWFCFRFKISVVLLTRLIHQLSKISSHCLSSVYRFCTETSPNKSFIFFKPHYFVYFPYFMIMNHGQSIPIFHSGFLISLKIYFLKRSAKYLN